MKKRGKEMTIELNKLKQSTFVVVDLETTGLSPKFAKITEIGAIKIVNGKMVEQFHTLINPEVKIPKKIVETTGITDEMVKDKPTYEEVLPHFYRFIEGAVVVCHNVNFDWNRFLMFYFKRLGFDPINDVLDTVKLFKALHPKMKTANLEAMSQTLGVPLDNHHRALSDAMVTGYCFLKLQQMAFEQEAMGLISSEAVEEVVEKSPIPLQEIYPKVTTSVVMANYWEKEISKKTTYRRIYVSLRDGQVYGRVYLDLTNRTWYNKDFPHRLDFDKVAQQTARFLNLADVEALMSYHK